MCSTYSPGSLNVTVVVDFPRKGTFSPPPANVSIAGRSLSNMTVPGPRYVDHASRTGGGRFFGGAIVPLANLASSSAHTETASGDDTRVVRVAAVDRRATGP